MKEKMDLSEQRRVKELETLQQKHAEVVDEIDQMFVCISQCLYLFTFFHTFNQRISTKLH